MALFRTLLEGCDLLVLANGSKLVSRRGLCSGGAVVQRVRRHSLPGAPLPSMKVVRGGNRLGGAVLCEQYQLAGAARCVSSAQRAPSMTEIRSSIQDHIDPSGVVKTKKFVVSAEELSAMLDKGPDGVKLIDVREQKEVEETGLLPRAVNIPLSTLKASLQLDAEMFEIQYGLKKPTKDDPIPLVFYGRSAVKSSTALEIAYKLGLKKSRHYPGGWEEWSTRSQPGV